jgi:hypothetical protein
LRHLCGNLVIGYFTVNPNPSVLVDNIEFYQEEFV